MNYYYDMHILVHETPLKDRKQTSDEIKSLIDRFHTDLRDVFLPSGVPLSQLSLDEFYNFVRNLKYRKDTEPVERVGRPAWIIEQCNAGKGADCKKKAVLVGSWLRLHEFPFRLIGSSTRPDKAIHHIFPQAQLLPGEWTNVDATYNNYHIGQQKKVSAKEIL